MDQCCGGDGGGSGGIRGGSGISVNLKKLDGGRSVIYRR